MTSIVPDRPPQMPPQMPSQPTSQSVDATAREFEAVFLSQMAKLMLESAEAGGEFGGGHGESVFRGVLAEEIGKAASNGAGIGLAPAVARQMLMMQGDGDER